MKARRGRGLTGLRASPACDYRREGYLDEILAEKEEARRSGPLLCGLAGTEYQQLGQASYGTLAAAASCTDGGATAGLVPR